MNHQLSASAELMTNYVHASLMEPRERFEALQTDRGDSLLFSVSTPGTLELTHEAPGTTNGWATVDLSSQLPGRVKTFDAAQNPADQSISLSLVMTDGKNDRLYLSLGNPAQTDHWQGAVTWTCYGFDAEGTTATPIVKTFISELTNGLEAAAQWVFVDVLDPSSASTDLIKRYRVSPRAIGGAHWVAHQLNIQLEADGYSSRVGRANGDATDGLYTVGRVGQLSQLVYHASVGKFGGNPRVYTLQLPDRAEPDAIAPCRRPDGNTELFVSGAGSLYVFPENGQGNLAVGIALTNHPLFTDVTTLHAFYAGDRVYVWGLNRANQVFSTYCPVETITTAAAWSVPIPILSGVDLISPYVNRANQGSTFFAVGGNEIHRLSQSPTTTLWREQHITLPQPVLTAAPHKFSSYTTRVRVIDDNNQAVRTANVQLSAASRGAFYVNNLYTILDTTPIPVATDESGAVTVIEAVDGIHANPLTFQLTGGQALRFDPAKGSFSKISGLDADGLAAATIPTDPPTANSPKLVPPGTSRETLEAVAATNKQMGSAYTHLSGKPSLTALQVRAVAAPTGFADAILVDFGDLARWLKSKVEAVIHFVEDVAQGVYHFVAQIAGKVYRAVIHAAEQVVAAVEWVYNKIKVGLEDLVKFLSFLFSWSDILVTHRVMKNFLDGFAGYAIGEIGTVRTQLKTVMITIEDKIDAWAGIPPIQDTANGTTKRHPAPEGTHGAPAHHGMHHLRGNMHRAQVSGSLPSHGDDLLQDLIALVEKELDDITGAIQQFRTEVVDQLGTLSTREIMKRAVAIFVDTLLQMTEDLLDAFLAALENLLTDIPDLLKKPIEIPILSALYQDLAGEPLTLLDLICLVISIPATIVYKIASGGKSAPFPADAPYTQGLLSAATFPEFLRVLQPAATDGLGASPNNGMKAFSFVTGITAFFGTIGMIFINLKTPDFDPNKTEQRPFYALIGGVFNLAYLAPSLLTLPKWKGWYADMGNACTITAGVKGFAWAGFTNSQKKATPVVFNIVECLLNTAWNVPVIANAVANHSEATTDYKALIPETIGNLCFNIGGMLEPLAGKPIENEYVKAVQFVSMGIYGLMMPVGTGIYAFTPGQQQG